MESIRLEILSADLKVKGTYGHPSTGEDLMLKFEVSDQSIWISILEL